jgi:hypothetical protein
MCQRFVGCCDIRPDRPEQLLLAHQAFRILQKIAQQLEALWTQRNLAVGGSQRVALGIQRISLELEHLQRRAAGSPSLPTPARGGRDETIFSQITAFFQGNYTVLSGLPLPSAAQSAPALHEAHRRQCCMRRT